MNKVQNLMKKEVLQKIKVLGIALAIVFSMNYVHAFGPTAPAPGNNVDGLIDVSDTYQAKGYDFKKIIPAVRLDVDDETNLNDTLSTTSLAVWDRATVANDTYIINLNPDGSPEAVCADNSGKLVICP